MTTYDEELMLSLERNFVTRKVWKYCFLLRIKFYLKFERLVFICEISWMIIFF